MHNTNGDVVLMDISPPPPPKLFPWSCAVSKIYVLHLFSARSMFLNFGHFAASCSYKKRSYKRKCVAPDEAGTKLNLCSVNRPSFDVICDYRAVTTVFNFTRPWGVFHQKKIVFRLPSIIDTIYGNAWGEPALALRVTVFSYRWRVVYLFSEGFRVQNIATILHVGCAFLKKLMKL